MELEPPKLSDVFAARTSVYKYLARTPLIKPLRLSRALECDVYLKCENLQPTGAFKVRGGINLVSKLSPDMREKGVIAASTGNHGQSVAYAAGIFGVKSVIAMPENANPLKAEAIRMLGGEVALHGRNYEEAKTWAEAESVRKGYLYIHSGDEPLLISGVGTLFLEIIEDVPDIDLIIVPVGGGSGASAACIVAKGIDSRIKVIGVQAESAPAVYLSWKSEKRITEPSKTFAEGLATGAPFDLPLSIMRRMLDDMVLVSETDLKLAILALLESTHMLAEGAGAAATAAAYKLKDRLRGQKVALILSGGNLTLEQLDDVMRSGSQRPR